MYTPRLGLAKTYTLHVMDNTFNWQWLYRKPTNK